MAFISIYQYGDLYKIVWNKSGITNPNEFILNESKEKHNNSEKLENNIRRAKSTIIEYANCNEWEYFFTFTIDKEKQDRFDLKKYIKDLGNWIGNYNKKYNTKLQYILIPEQHHNGAWHAHGLLNGVTKDSIIINKFGYMDMPYYADRFGYISLSQIRDKRKVSFYLTKYISKDFSSRLYDSGAHLFYTSKGLKKRDICFQGEIAVDKNALYNEMYITDYCGIMWCDSIPDFISKADIISTYEKETKTRTYTDYIYKLYDERYI